ncbi:class I SAM-dependent methyltransferase [Devosia sp. SL43]|uniref:class I SAM-dependent methyltransferase n=1 Tax=Devosia sp. SL43 TaxID=2806348 RepID=UPI001F224643|nr:class I SAM-dependent methyltransferase [Devosia sp. SL43]UJW84065.1 class I SAM-dependent methyltransferase [Devosia sp. SL43]
MPDRDTLKFYADNAATYVQHADRPTPQLAGFLKLLAPGATVLELGTGNGRDAAAMLAAGFAVTPSDASPELAAEAERRIGVPVRIMAFHELSDIAAYDGVWACACLLHAPRDELTDDLARIFRALRPGGHLVASFKAGGGEGRDQLGRYYNYPDAAELRGHLTQAATWASIDISENDGSGYDGKPTRWLWVHAGKTA